MLNNNNQIQVILASSVQFSSVAQLCLTLCDHMNRSLLIRVLPLGKIVFLKRDALGRLMYVWFSPVDWSWLLLLQGQNDLSPSLGNEMIDKDETEFKLICFFSFFGFIYFFTLQDCIGFAIYQHESATGIHVFPILNPPPSCLPIPSLWAVPVHQPQASSIVHRSLLIPKNPGSFSNK